MSNYYHGAKASKQATSVAVLKKCTVTFGGVEDE